MKLLFAGMMAMAAASATAAISITGVTAALILIGYSDPQLKRFLEEVKRYEPAAAGEALDSVMNRSKDSPYALPLAPDLMLRTMQRKEARRNAKHPANR